MKDFEIRAGIEAILFANGEPVQIDKIAQALEEEETIVQNEIENLTQEYTEENRGIMIVRLNNSYQLCSKKKYAENIRKIMDLKRNTPLSQAALEVLAVIAYNQPVTKAFVEQVRGVDCSGVIGSLTTKGLIQEAGRLELPGRPLLYATTDVFLRSFQIENLEQLPEIPQKKTEKEEDKNEENKNENTEEQENKDIELKEDKNEN